MKDMLKVKGLFLCWVFFGVVLSGRADETVTNQWIAADGGQWSDPANWSDPINIGTNTGTACYADFTKLNNGANVTVSRDVWTKGVLFGGNEGSSWTIQRSDWWPKLRFIPLDAEDWSSPFCVTGGLLKLAVEVEVSNGAYILKTGVGDLRMEVDNGTAMAMVVAEGRLLPASRRALGYADVRVQSPTAGIVLQTDIVVNSIRLNPGVPPVELNGYKVSLLSRSEKNVCANSPVGGSGTVAVVNQSLMALATKLAVTNGCINPSSGDIMTDVSLLPFVCWYRFEGTDPGEDTSCRGRTIVSKGTPRIVTDEVRGKVLELDGSSWLTGPLSDGSLPGAPTGSVPYTVSFWFKPDAGTDPAATLYFWGTPFDTHCEMTRLSLSDSAHPQTKLLHSNYGNNNWFSSAVIQDGNWHHFVLTHGADNQTLCWIDSVLAMGQQCTLNLQVGTFYIGNGANNRRFKGRIDDFMILDGTMLSADALAALSAADIARPSVPPSLSVMCDMNGTLRIGTPSTNACLFGSGYIGGVDLASGCDLTVTGDGTERSDIFEGRISGAGGFVKTGADYSLTLKGLNTYTGPTRVEQGKLTLCGDLPFLGLAAAWTFEDPSLPGRDTSGNKFDLNVVGGAKVVLDDDPRRGHVLELAAGDYLSSTEAGYPDVFPFGASAYTIAFWFKANPSCHALAGLVCWGSQNFGKCGLIRLAENESATSSRLMFTNWGTNHETDSQLGTSLRDGVWHHVIWSAERNSETVWVDGRKVDTWVIEEAALNISLNDRFTLGTARQDGRPFVGRLDDARFYARAFTDAEAMSEFQGINLPDPGTSGAIVREAEWLPAPVLWYAFEDAERPGFDSSENACHLNVKGSPAVVTDPERSGHVLKLDTGVMSYLEAPDLPSVLPLSNTSSTISCWFRTTERTTQDDTLVYWGLRDWSAVGDTYFYLFGFFRDVITLRETVKSLIDWTPEWRSLKLGSTFYQWHHAAGVWDGVNKKFTLYLDGARVHEAVNSSGLNVQADTFWIGRKASSSTAWFRGYLDDVRIYNVPLSEEQIHVLGRAELRGEKEGVLSEGGVLQIASGGCARLERTHESLDSISGAGELFVSSDAQLDLTNNTAFVGKLTGGGCIRVVGGAADFTEADASDFYGCFELVSGSVKASLPIRLADDLVIRTNAEGVGLPVVETTAAVQIPASALIDFGCDSRVLSGKSFVLACGDSADVVSDNCHWSVAQDTNGLARFAISGGMWTVRFIRPSLSLIVR